MNKQRKKTFTLGRESGFTLTEVMIVTGVIALMAAIAIPNIISWLPDIRLKAAARGLYSNLQKAKLEAVKSNTTVSFSFTAGTENPCEGGSYTFTSGSEVVISATMPDRVCLFTPRNFPDGFLSTALPSGSSGTIKLSHPDSNRIYTITQTSAGGITFQKE
jgi:type IV fimbrial biogenesis protein FimT